MVVHNDLSTHFNLLDANAVAAAYWACALVFSPLCTSPAVPAPSICGKQFQHPKGKQRS